MKNSAAVKAAPEQESIADKLDRLVAERTAELATANEQLRKEVVALQEAAQLRREGELNFNLIVDSIPAPVAVTSPSGEVEALNQATLEYFGSDFLLRRHDYNVEVAGGFPAAQYVYDIVEADGLRFPTKRRAYLRGPRLKPIRDLLLVSIDISNFRLR